MKEIEKIITAYNRVDWSREQAALGIVVKVEGSAYRRIGARLFFCSNGHWTGGISGGCLEGDALKHAQKAILNNKPSIVVYDTTEDDPHQIGVGLGCNGRIEVLFIPIDGKSTNNQLEFLKTITNSRQSNVLIQVLNVCEGNHSLQGKFYTTSDLKKLAQATQIPLETLEEKIKYTYHRRKSKVFKLENSKGEHYEMLAELIQPKIKLICIGDNYDVNALLEITNVLGWEVHIVGKLRKLSKKIHQSAHRVYSLAEISTIAIDEYTAVVLMSHDYKTDLTALKEFIHKDLVYLGLLGPKKRMRKMQDALNEVGEQQDLEQLTHVHGPVGLDIGAESPEEIALSITAEIIAAFRNRKGGLLKHRQGSIYERNHF